MSLFSLPVLLENETAREWLLCRTEHSIQPSTIETAYALEAEVEVDGHLSSLELLVKPVGVVNRVLIGYVLGDPYYFALPRFWGPMVHPACRRFIFDLDRGEFLEFHWYVHNNTVLVNWMKFPTSDHRIRYFILFEAPEVDKLPYKLLQSIEILTERASSEDCRCPVGSFQFPSYVEEELNSVPIFLHTLQSLLGVFGGTCRWTSYNPQTLESLNDTLFSYSVVICNMKHADSLRKRELQRFCHCFVDLNPTLKHDHLSFRLYDSDSFEHSVHERNTLVCNNSDGISTSECMVCQSRQQSLRVMGWTNSWNFVPEEYLASQEMLSTRSEERNRKGQEDDTCAMSCTLEQSLPVDSYSSPSACSVFLSERESTSTDDVLNKFTEHLYNKEAAIFLASHVECPENVEDIFSSTNQEVYENMFSDYTKFDDNINQLSNLDFTEYFEPVPFLQYDWTEANDIL